MGDVIRQYDRETWRITAMVTQNGTHDHACHASTRTEGKKRQKALVLTCLTLRPSRSPPRRSLPWWCVYVAWLLVASSAGMCGYYTMLYGLKFGKEKSISWLVSMSVSFFQSLLLIQPLKVVGLAVFFALVVKKVDEEELDNVQIHRDKVSSSFSRDRDLSLYWVRERERERRGREERERERGERERRKRNREKEHKAYALLTEILGKRERRERGGGEERERERERRERGERETERKNTRPTLCSQRYWVREREGGEREKRRETEKEHKAYALLTEILGKRERERREREGRERERGGEREGERGEREREREGERGREGEREGGRKRREREREGGEREGEREGGEREGRERKREKRERERKGSVGFVHVDAAARGVFFSVSQWWEKC
ncbi:hypothetical protein WMY93_001957 [Mugilogobius chulae]|uniref:Uncharacterized protein n=1 Tax=Mugilogobius chulae TaxID=88201 RepID=A0AAW0Q798_9GOBI